MRRKIASLFIVLTMFDLCACSTKVENPTWQEQFDLGVRYLSEGNYEEAILAFSAAIEIDPKQAEAYEKLADVYLALGDTEAALQALKDGYAATGDAKLQARIVDVVASESSPTQEPSHELPTESAPVVTPTSRPDLYPMDYIGMTIDSLTELWGSDYRISEYLYLGGARPLYYEDGRIQMTFFYLDLNYENIVRGDEKIILVNVSTNIDEVAPGIPTRATYSQLSSLSYSGELWEGDESEGVVEGSEGETAIFTIKYSPEISIHYFWYNFDDPKTTQAKTVEIWKSTEPTQTSTSTPDAEFRIENGVLVEYSGSGGQ